MRFVIFDNSYTCREYIGYIDASSKQEALRKLENVVHFCRIVLHHRQCLTFGLTSPMELATLNDDTLETETRDYIASNFELREVDETLTDAELEQKYADGYNWGGNLSEYF